MYRLETYIFPVIGKRPICKLEKADLLARGKPLEDKGHHETSLRVVQIVNQVFRYAEMPGKVKYNIADGLCGVLHPRKVTHRATITDPKKVERLLGSPETQPLSGCLVACLTTAILPRQSHEVNGW